MASPRPLGEGLTYLGESLGDVIGDYRMRGDERAFASRQDEMLKGGSTPTYGNPATESPGSGVASEGSGKAVGPKSRTAASFI